MPVRKQGVQAGRSGERIRLTVRTTFEWGRISGIPVRVHLNWFLTAGLVIWTLAAGYYPQEYPGWESTAYWLAGAGTAMFFFSSVLLHELGHAWTAQREGVPVQSITIFILGGVAHIQHEPPTPQSEFRIVIAGPLTSLLLAVFFFGLALLPGSPALQASSAYLFRINLVLAFFNLLPGFPLDGGRILRAFLWKLLGRFETATRWATLTGLGMAALLVLSGIAFMALGNLIGGLWVVLIGGYLGMVANTARTHAELNQAAGHSRDERGALQPESVPDEFQSQMFRSASPEEPQQAGPWSSENV